MIPNCLWTPFCTNMAEEGGQGSGGLELTRDGTVDLKGRPFVRSKGGGWKACSFIVGYEVFERMAYYGIASNLVVYLTSKLHEGTVPSSNNVTNWAGTVWMTPIIGAYIADAHLGRYWTFVIASAIYLLGMGLLTLTVSLKSLRPPPCNSSDCNSRATPFQVGIFYASLYIIAIGTGGTKPNISTMGADQFDDFEPKERTQKLSFFNWWMFSIFFGSLFANTFLVYIQDNRGFSIGYGIPTLGLGISVVIFLIGTPLYRHKVRTGSPFTQMVQVLVAAIRKWRVPLPADPKDLYELDIEEYEKGGKFRIEHSTSLRFFDKAATKSGPDTKWTLCTVTQVEETKQIFKMLPVLLTTFIPSAVAAQTMTLFVKQGTTLDRRMGPHFQFPAASLGAFVTIFMLITIVVYDRAFVPFIRKYTKNPRGVSLLQRMGIGIVMHVFIMFIAALVERKRLSVIKEHGTFDNKDVVPISIFILLPQYALMGIADAFVEVAKLEFFYDQAPEGMKSLGTSYFSTSLGVGNFLSSFILTTVSDVTKRNGSKGWIQDNLNACRLDYFYVFVAVLSGVNLVFYLVMTKLYVYNSDVVELEIEMRKGKNEVHPSRTAGSDSEIVGRDGGDA
ncbi:protein NRT1/ PTR FAMILY 5.2-like [Asparagus officinalis]|uniref:protein NRT1/ PTR FAMILY 5.2-like n=1 Tax=Asparagus officinalis TaxID=4686 RepID=UPI00098E68BD|nr:protein NRT1/ PTR FAMILY 5.2-like [Asparagus officinalis]